MALIGYARVSTEDQDLSIQLAALRAAGCDVVRGEKRSGNRTDDRTELQNVLEFARQGDVVAVTRLDRLARSSRDLYNLLHDLEVRGVGLRALEQSVDTTTAAGRAFFGMVAVFAQFETDIRRERQREGIAAAKAKGGVYKGRKPSVPVAEIRQLKSEGVRPTDIARRLGIGRASVYRALEAST